MQLLTSEEFDAMSYEDRAKIANGCGPAKCKWCTKYLNSPAGLYLADACNIHDVDYHIGGDAAKRRNDDMRFVLNLIIVALSHPSHLNLLRVPYLFSYYLAVRWKGRHFYNFR